MRLACLSTDPGIAYGATKGASVHLAELTTALARAGAEVLLLVARIAPGGRPPERIVLEQLPEAPPGRLHAGPREQERLSDWLVARLVAFGCDALYERLALASDAGSRAARALGIPHLVELDAPLAEEAARYRGLEDPGSAAAVEAEVLRSADAVLPVSPPLATYASGLGARRVVIVQNGADPARYPARRPAGVPRAVFSGSLRPWHGIETIVQAWALLRETAPPLSIIGDGPSRSLLAQTGMRLEGSVPSERVPALLGAADIGLAPYAWDAPDYFSPLKLFEYLAAGLATVVGDLPAVRDVVDGDTAVIIPQGDAKALADAVARLAADPKERSRLGMNARRLVAAQHTWAHRAGAVLQAIADLKAPRIPA